jgi:integrase/recombinase XerD
MPGLAAAVAPFEQLVVDFLAYLEFERGRSPNTLAAYRGDLAQYGRHLAGAGVAAALAEPTVLMAFVAELAAGGGERPPASAATLQRKVACLRSFYRHLRREGILERDPTIELRLPPRVQRLPHVLTGEEVARLLARPRGGEPGPLRDRALLELIAASGLRASEVIGLHAADVDRRRRVLRVTGKGGRERAVPLRGTALAVVAAYLDRGRPALVGQRAEPHLFVNRRGGRLTRQGLYKIVQGYAEEAGLAGRMSPNTLRHTFASHALAGGRDVRSVQEILGHADIASTRLYREVSAD